MAKARIYFFCFATQALGFVVICSRTSTTLQCIPGRNSYFHQLTILYSKIVRNQTTTEDARALDRLHCTSLPTRPGSVRNIVMHSSQQKFIYTATIPSKIEPAAALHTHTTHIDRMRCFLGRHHISAKRVQLQATKNPVGWSGRIQHELAVGHLSRQ